MFSEIKILQEKISVIAEQLYQNDLVIANKGLAEVFPEINRIYLTFINDSEKYSEKGIDIPQDILISQMKNLIEAYESKDILMLADTLKYEIYNGLSFCDDVLNSLGK